MKTENTTKNDLQKMKLAGQVRFIRISHFSPYQSLEKRIESIAFNTYGNKTERLIDYPTRVADMLEKEKYTYDDAQRLIALESYNQLGDMVSAEFNLYDFVGKLLRTLCLDLKFSSKLELEETLYTYDEKGRRTKLVCSNKNELEFIIRYSYDANDLVYEEVYQDSFGSRKTTKKYDQDGNLMEEILEFIGTKEPEEYAPQEEYIFIKYLENGKRIEQETRLKDTEKIRKKEVNLYDDEGNRIEFLKVNANGCRYKEVDVYNEHGDLIRATKTGDFDLHENSKSSQTQSYAYTYDGRQNWVKKELISATGKIVVAEREIQYAD